MYFFWAEGRVIKMIFYIENREKFLLFLGMELYVASASVLAVRHQGQLWGQGREMNLCSGIRLGSYQLREESSSPINKIHCGVCLHIDIISFIWRHFKLRNRRERNQWGSLGTGTLKTEPFCFLSLTTSPVLAGSRERPWFCWQSRPGWRPDRPKYLGALVYVLVYCS